MQKFYFIPIFVLVSLVCNSQIKEFDKLERLYDQQHYKIVYKRANKLIDNPKFDFSLVPLYYKSLTQIQLSQNEVWKKRNPKALNEAKKNLFKIKSTSDGKKVLDAHYYEIVYLKRDLINWLETLKKENKKETYEFVQDFLADFFENIPDIEEDNKDNYLISKEVKSNENENTKKIREKLIAYSKKFIGSPYLVSGTSPSGFDCSGFTSFVYKEVNIEIPRSAKEQFEKCVKVKEKEVAKGDLIFFTNGSFISHVGIIVSNTNEPLVMIHASSTKGIVITEITKSAYWMKKIAGFGKFISGK
jgi:peptidoglycan DL-endopeptidase CwlO